MPPLTKRAEAFTQLSGMLQASGSGTLRGDASHQIFSAEGKPSHSIELLTCFYPPGQLGNS